MREIVKTARGLATNILLVIRQAFLPTPIRQPIPVPKAHPGIRRGGLRR